MGVGAVWDENKPLHFLEQFRCSLKVRGSGSLHWEDKLGPQKNQKGPSSFKYRTGGLALYISLSFQTKLLHYHRIPVLSIMQEGNHIHMNKDCS